MRILCIANDIPLPANSGGRVDVWRRLCALKACGYSVALLCWTDSGRTAPPSKEVLDELASVCDAVKIVSIKRSALELLQRLLQLWRWPSHVAARAVTARGGAVDVWARTFSPDVVLLDGLYGGALAIDLANVLSRPLWYRSHNIEHRYMAAQCVRESRWVRRLGLWVSCLGLERFERLVLARADRVFDISLDDAATWRAQGVDTIEWLPTLVDAAYARRLAEQTTEAPFDVLYFGNLNTPNNVEAVLWWVDEVLPRVRGSDLKIAVAGSRPNTAVRDAIARDPRIQLIENPRDMASVVARARVLVNPMRAGSGVNLKSVEMLFSNAALVSTSVGVGGLSPAAKECFSVADSSEKFAAAIIAGLERSVTEVTAARRAVREEFSPAVIKRAFERTPAEVAA